MWLDRLAGQANNPSGSSSPQPASRPYSPNPNLNPLPRRTSNSLSPYVTSQRAGHSPRGSSLSLVSNDSSNSLLSQGRKPNASTLRQTSTVYGGPDSLQVLEKLLRTPDDDEARQGTFIREDDFDLDPGFGGLSLKELASSNSQQDDTTLSATPRSQTVQEC